MSPLRLALPAAVAVLAASALAQTLPPGVQKKASLGGVTEYDYPNGLRVLLYPDPASPKVTVNMTYLVGSRFEGYGETGMAHLLEHMNFIETTSGRQIKNEIVSRGASWNGTTSEDRTNYFETVPATDDNLQWALGLEADRMVNMKMAKELLDTEMTVVRNEFERGENNPREILDERVESTAYLWHNYGKSTIGSRSDIERVPIDRLAAFVLGVGHDVVNAGSGSLPRRGASIGEDVGHLLRQTAEILAQHLQILLQVAGGRAGGSAHVACTLARFTGGVAHVAGDRRGVAHALLLSAKIAD